MICIIHSITGTTAKWSTSNMAKIRIFEASKLTDRQHHLHHHQHQKYSQKLEKPARKDESKNCRCCCKQTIGLYSLFSLKSLQQLPYCCCCCCFCSDDHAGAQDPAAGGDGGGGSPPPSPPPQQHRPRNIPKNKPTNKNTYTYERQRKRAPTPNRPPNFHFKTKKVPQKKNSLEKV